MRMTSKGQVTIPIALREKAGLMPNSEVAFDFEDGKVLLFKPKKGARKPKMKEWIRKLRGSATVKLTTDEIMKMTRAW